MTTNGLFTQLDMGKRALSAQQSGMGTAGHNIANIDNKGYTRQRVSMEAQHALRSRFGAGVDVQGVERATDRFLNQRLISEQSRGGDTQVRDEGLRRLEGMFAEVEGFGLRNSMNEFWAAWGRLTNAPEHEVARQDLLDAATGLAQRINTMNKDFVGYRKELNGRLAERVEQVNLLSGRIVEMNIRIQQTDRGKGESNDLRDERGAALKELSRLVQIEWFEDEDKLVNVTIANGFPLVNGRRQNQLEASFDHDEVGFFSLKGIDPKGISRVLTPNLRSGELKEYVSLRDDVMVGFINRLDELAAELSFRVNRIHNGGTGLQTTYDVMNSSFALKPDAVQRPLPFLEDGLFRLHLVSPDNEFLETYEVELRPGQDTVSDIVERINATIANPNLLEARLNDDGTVSIEAKGPHSFVLGDDETGFSALMGFNNFFENLQGAQDFRVNPKLRRNPNLIATGKGLLPGDNSVALAINALQFQPTMAGEAITFDEYYNGMIAELGLKINRAKEERHNQELILDQFQKLRDEISSVNMDEEVADMVQYQRGFEAAARFVTTVDEMTKSVIQM